MVSLSEMPLFLRQATIAIEDKEFYRHSGFSITGTLRAFWRNSTGKQVEGGSTITQQLVKTALLSPERTLQRKIRELVLSIAVELLYSKDQILEMYLNRVSYGGEAYGVEEASQSYFKKVPVKFVRGSPSGRTSCVSNHLFTIWSQTRACESPKRGLETHEDKFITWEQAQSQ